MIRAIIPTAASEDGATAIEYGLLGAFAGIAAVQVMASLGVSLVSIFEFVTLQQDEAADQHRCVEVAPNCNNRACPAAPPAEVPGASGQRLERRSPCRSRYASSGSPPLPSRA